ncbi:MAG: hypothetical protein KBC78_02485 [Candidatus Pacebacteria bacterium]|nr:hypothetical protein [Candidatus Paceibacterota bacterium]
MSIKEQENIDELRKRLYDRGANSVQTGRHDLTQETVEVSRGWAGMKKPAPTNPVSEKTTPSISATIESVQNDEVSKIANDFSDLEKPKRPYRLKIVLASLAVLVLAVLVSSLYMIFGGNSISGDNISVSMSAPFAVAGGEVVPIQLSVTNQNTVAIESATLIINYPPGSKSAEEKPRDLYEERIPVEKIDPGQALNIPVKAVLYGEENEEKEIRATVEYRVVNSNATFFKEANPVIVKINSSPLVIRVESVEKISSGQEMDIVLTVQSNSTSPMNDVLVVAGFPSSFSPIKSEPSPVSAQNVWMIDEVLPDKTYTIKIRGLVTGLASEDAEMQFKAGNPKADNPFELGAVLTQTRKSYTIEEPFIGVKVNINGDADGEAVLSAKGDTTVSVIVTNTLNESVYDMRVEILPNGNMVRSNNISVGNGFFDSNSKKINWEISGMSSLEKVLPGETREFEFSLEPDEKQATGAFDVSVKVFARRVGEANASEEVIGTTVAKAKYSSSMELKSEAAHKSDPFDDRGPIPPVAGKSTDYTLTLQISAGVNDLTKAVLTTSLPQYVTWLNKTEGGGKVEFNPVSKQLVWEAGDITANQDKQLQMQVSLLPSVTHIDRTLTLLESQDLRAVDRFTNETLQIKSERLDNELSEEQGFARDNGVVKEE